MGKYISWGIFGVIALAVMAAVFGASFTVKETERTVLLRNGKFVEVAQPGFHLKMPFITDTKAIQVTGESRRWEKLQAYSRDQQPADMAVSVSFNVQPGQVEQLYKKYNSIDAMISRVIDRQVPQALENVFGKYTAISAVQDRTKLVADVNKAVKEAMADEPVTVSSVQIEGLSFSDAYDKAVEDRMTAQVAVEQSQQDLEKAKITSQIALTNAKAEADANFAKLDAEAKGIKAKGDAEASAIKAKGEALKQAGDTLVAYIYATTWKGNSPTTVVPNTSITGLSLPGQQKPQ
ncbi:structural protein [Pectobacterium phage vB_PcaM_CBB]|uniref:Structural protein n=1 Tax=Pectobacterium phage vB_PcaM_CBB TaxID=2772511 RepID=A0A1L2CVV0_9CAUD|nr:structural protein [Pectobacterium phage vB_PcaM_CBB]YP_009595122.1 structural protein [Pectobacterium phage vB_PcaM_CBB]AMM43594.1 structural protein [Pectobacterium phage vB_PcaM_CBB]AMM44145.1 structural protein [Pectobacterium phage vB_PcaM_CBB]